MPPTNRYQIALRANQSSVERAGPDASAKMRQVTLPTLGLRRHAATPSSMAFNCRGNKTAKLR